MKHNKLNSSEMEISSIVYGSWAIGGWMWGGADKNDAIKAIETAYNNGITTFDTAPVYGFGQSEELIGKALSNKRKNIRLLTKYGLRWDTQKGVEYFDTSSNDGKPLKIHKFAGRESVIKECEESLSRLKTDYIDLYQIHWPDPSTPIDETMESVSSLIKAGKVLKAGVSNFSKKQLEEALSAFPVVSNQVPYSMVNRDIEKELVPFCVENNVSILAYSPLQRGLLTGKIKPGHRFNKGDHRQDSSYFQSPQHERIMDFLEKINPIADSHFMSLSQLAIYWTLQQPGITAALAGARNSQQAEENSKASGYMLSPDDLNAVNTHLESLFDISYSE